MTSEGSHIIPSESADFYFVVCSMKAHNTLPSYSEQFLSYRPLKDVRDKSCTLSCEPQELRAQLEAALEQVDTLHEHQQQRDTERRELEQKIQEVRQESQEAKKTVEESLTDSNRDRSSLELISKSVLTEHLFFVSTTASEHVPSHSYPRSFFISHREKCSLEKLLSELQQEVNSQRAEMEVLQSSSLELQRQKDVLRQQKQDLEMQLARQQLEAQRGYGVITENDHYTKHILTGMIVCKPPLFRVQISNTCHSLAGSAPA